MVAYAYNPSYLGGWGMRMAWTWEVEVAVSPDGTTAFQPGWQSKTLSQQQQQKDVSLTQEITIMSVNLTLPQMPLNNRNFIKQEAVRKVASSL